MKIKFIKPDPRAGMEAVMDSSRGQQLIDAGSAKQVSESAESNHSEPSSTKDDEPKKVAHKSRAKGT